MSVQNMESPRSPARRAERLLETGIFNSRWLMALFYVGLVISLPVAAAKFIAILYEFTIQAWTETEADLIVDVLALIDLSLVGNLTLIVVLSGYVNFVSRIDPDGHPDWPKWMAKIEFAGLKQRLLALNCCHFGYRSAQGIHEHRYESEQCKTGLACCDSPHIRDFDRVDDLVRSFDVALTCLPDRCAVLDTLPSLRNCKRIGRCADIRVLGIEDTSNDQGHIVDADQPSDPD